MKSIVLLVVLLRSLIRYPQPVGDVWDEDTRLRMEVRAKQLEWDRIRLEREVEQLALKQVQLLKLLAVAVLLVLVVVLWFVGWKSSLRRGEHEEDCGANEEEVGNVETNQEEGDDNEEDGVDWEEENNDDGNEDVGDATVQEEDHVGNEVLNEAANAGNNNDVANAVQEENDRDDNIGRTIMECIQWPVQDLQKGREWTTGLMDNFTAHFGHILSNSFYPVLERAIGVGSAFEGWSPHEEDVAYQVLIPMTPPRGHNFQLEQDTAAERHVRNFRVRVQLECTSTREQQGENMLCFLHHSKEELRGKQDPSLLDTLCIGSYLDVHKTAHWFYQLVRATWPALPQSQSWHLILLPSRCSCQFKMTNGRESFRVEMLFGVRRGDSDIFVSSQPREAHTPSTTWPETYAVAEMKFFQHIAKQAPPDALHLRCLQFLTRLLLGSCFPTYSMKTLVMHRLNFAPPSEWRRRDFLERLVEIIKSLGLCLQVKCLNHFIVGNQGLPQNIHLPPDVLQAKPYNLFHHLAQQLATHHQAMHDYQVLRECFQRILLAED